MRKYSGFDSKILRILFALNSHATVRETNIDVGHPSDWLVIFVDLDKRIYSSFE